jgi:glycosyltransferase involved in cell wall biosynthesis
VKLVASLLAHNERSRYLEPCIRHLQEFCDAVYLYDDGSTDGTSQRAHELGAVVSFQGRSTFFEHEGRTRQRALDWALTGRPTHVLSLDCDEFVDDGPALRCVLESSQASEFSLEMCEVWRAFDECLCVRMDGGWRPHGIPALWRVPGNPARLRIADRALACGRVPVSIDQRARHAQVTGASLLHFGWANESERAARHHRYAVADGGRFHQSQHLASILWPNDKVAMDGRVWPASLEPVRAQILDYATGVAA